MYLYLAEKPSTMRAVQQAYKKNREKLNLGDIKFMALAGHVCALSEPKEYDQWNVKWRERELPMVPKTWRVKAIRKEIVDSVEKEIKSGKIDAIIVGTDSDTEGNGIYDLLSSYLGLEGYKTYRFFETDLTEGEIVKSFQNLTDYHTNQRDVGMTQAFRIRSRFDWLTGFNLTTAYSVKSGFLMKVGRVKAPTLKLIYDNCRAIDNFRETTAYQPEVLTDNPEITAFMTEENGKVVSFEKKEDAQKAADALPPEAEVLSFTKTKKNTPPPQLFKLSDIQVEAGKKYGYSASKTLEIIQELYEKYKIVSYPRTDGRYLSSEKANELKPLLKAVMAVPELRSAAKKVTDTDIERVKKDPRFINDEEVKKASHGALIPTGTIPDMEKLNQEEKNICMMIYRRFLAMFLPPAEEEKERCILKAGNSFFTAAGSVLKAPGFTVLYELPKNRPLPDVTKGQRLAIKKTTLHEITSTPPARLTQTSIIKAMENVQKYIEGEEYKKILKKTGGIGQPSSRAAIIDDLINTGYVETKGKNNGLYITQDGKAYIENLHGCSIESPVTTAKWEEHMEEIRRGEATYDEVYPEILKYMNGVLDEIDKAGTKKMNAKCPLCGADVIKAGFEYKCTKCDFSFHNRIAGKALTDEDAEDLLAGKTVGPISGLKKKDGTTFSAKIRLNQEGKLTWAPSDTQTEWKCPKCGRPIVETPKAYTCSASRDGDCDFVLWKEILGHKLTKKQAGDLLEMKETGEISGLKSRRTGKTFRASLRLSPDDGYKVKFSFSNRDK